MSRNSRTSHHGPWKLARIEGRLYGIPRNLDVKLLYYRTDLVPGPPSSWEELRNEAVRLRSDEHYGFVFPGKESGLFGTLLRAARDGRGTDVRGRRSPCPPPDRRGGALGAQPSSETSTSGPRPRRHPDWHYDEVAAC